MATLSTSDDLDADLAKRTQLFLVKLRNELRALDVHAHDDVIVLRGSVPTFYLRQLAIACARRVAGVRSVVDEIEVDSDRRDGPDASCTSVRDLRSRRRQHVALESDG